MLLPPLYALRRNAVYAEYNHGVLCDAVEDLIGSLPQGRSDYLAAVRSFGITVYAKLACNGERYFLDKTPRYHLVAPEIIEAFPDARFIFLWRNPLAVVVSMLNTWWRGRWKLMSTTIDLYAGLASLVEAYKQHGERAISVRYEDLLLGTSEWERLFAYLDLPFDQAMLTELRSKQIDGRMGDPTGAKTYAEMSQEPLDRWRSYYFNPLRIWWGKRYLRWIGSDRLAIMGYSFEELYLELSIKGVGLRGIFSDGFGMARDFIAIYIEPFIMLPKVKELLDRKRQYVHR